MLGKGNYRVMGSAVRFDMSEGYLVLTLQDLEVL